MNKYKLDISKLIALPNSIVTIDEYNVTIIDKITNKKIDLGRINSDFEFIEIRDLAIFNQKQISKSY